MNDREWERIKNTMDFIIEQQGKFEVNFAEAHARFAEAEKRMDRLERFADRVIRAGEARMAKAEARISVLEAADADLKTALAELARSQKTVLEALRRSGGNGRSRGRSN